MYRPSRDQSYASFSSSLWSRGCSWPPPPAAFVYRSNTPPRRSELKTIFFPSGDQAGWTWKKRPVGVDESPFAFVRRLGCLPFVSAPKIA
jgi:hypothetical protein